jgi:hypothetical protein
MFTRPIGLWKNEIIFVNKKKTQDSNNNYSKSENSASTILENLRIIDKSILLNDFNNLSVEHFHELRQDSTNEYYFVPSITKVNLTFDKQNNTPLNIRKRSGYKNIVPFEVKKPKDSKKNKNSFSRPYFWFITISVICTALLIMSPLVFMIFLLYALNIFGSIRIYRWMCWKWPNLSQSCLFRGTFWVFALGWCAPIGIVTGLILSLRKDS